MKKGILLVIVLLISAVQLFAGEPDGRKKSALNSYIKTTHESLIFDGPKPSYDVFRKSMIGYLKLKEEGKVKKDVLTVIDFTISSKKKRMWVIDMTSQKVLFHSFVAHGKNSGWDIPEDFSNTPNTNKSSLGFYLTGEEYIGKYGLSLRLDGMEKEFNSNARRRAIVMHPAKYVNPYISKSLGRMGRSFGCPAIPYKDSKKVIKAISNKSVMFIYSNNSEYLTKSTFGDEEVAYTYLKKSGTLL